MEKRFLNDTNILIYFLKDEIPLPDAVIAATCIVRGMILVTRNEKDFRNISELQVFFSILRNYRRLTYPTHRLESAASPAPIKQCSVLPFKKRMPPSDKKRIAIHGP